MEWDDGKTRCAWANPRNPAYLAYHDREWGVPCHDDGRLFEMLVLECFQAGLSWECILNKREAFRRADVERLMADAGIVRNRRKIEAAIGNARAFRAIQREFGSFDAYLWGWTGGEVVRETGLASSPLSDAVSADLRRRGMRFVGTTVTYAYLQSVGVIWSHDEDCFLHEEKAGK